MGQQQHTPGPWTVAPSDAEKVVADGIGVAVMSGGVRRGSAEREANARLIAAAPELLAALNGVLAWCIENEECPTYATRVQKGPTFEAARLAIARATGND